MNFIYCFLLCFSFLQIGCAQCPPSPVVFTTQESIDNFIIDYPFCNNHSGNIIIEGNSITDLSGLENFTYLGSLTIQNCESLENLIGLENLTSIGRGLLISSNSSLISLNGLDNIVSVGHACEIVNNSALTNLNGIGSLTSTGGSFHISNNSSLIALNGFESLESIGGSLYIENNQALTSITGMENLTNINYNLDIQNNEALISISTLNGLKNLTTIGRGFVITNNESMITLNGPASLTSVGWAFTISNNIKLINLYGLNSLHSTGSLNILQNTSLENIIDLENLTLITVDLRISSNATLRNFDGLQNLSAVLDDIEILDNPILQNLNDLESFNGSIVDKLTIRDNPELSSCSFQALCNSLPFSPFLDIWNNAPGCQNSDDVLSECLNPTKVNLPVYYDLNENAVQDVGEPFLSSAGVFIEPGDYTVYGNAINAGVKYLNYGTYSISFNENHFPNWELTNEDSSYNITLGPLNNSDTLPFGLYPTSDLSNIYTSCFNGLPRCNEFVNFDVLAVNEGTTTTNGTLWFDIDPAVLDVAYIDLPDTLDGANRIGWHFTDLFPAQTLKRKISIQFPGPPDFPLGDALDFSSQINFSDENGSHFNDLNPHSVVVLCSFDPNDKLVSPQYPENYSLIGENLIYTIRFQNTGNATAFDIVIKDLLSTDLDVSTFRYISSSHELKLSSYYLNDRMLTFEFKDIFLPDSTTNYDNSQGYVMYSIQAKDTIPEFTTINNTANIFFDSNPPVVTNTTENVMLSTFDFDEDGFDLWNDCDDKNELVNADATENPYNGIDDDCNELTLDDDLDQDGFLLADDCDDNNEFVNPDIVEEPYNGLDDDCDELTLDDDLDQDGFLLADDCNDEDPAINIDAEEIPNNGIDENCDGEDVIVATNDIITIQPQVFPNPSTDVLHIEFPFTSNASYSLIDISGNFILEGILETKTSLDLNDLSQGLYIIFIRTEQAVWSERIVLTK